MAENTPKKYPAPRLAQFWSRKYSVRYSALSSKVLLTNLFFLPLGEPVAQTITGVVKDGASKQPVTGVAILNKRTEDLYYSDQAGSFTIYALRGDTLKFTQLGYFDYEYILAGKTANAGIIRLTRNQELLDTVTIAKPLTPYQHDSLERLKIFGKQLKQEKESFKLYNHKYIVKPVFGLTFDGIISSLFQRKARKYKRLWKFQENFYKQERDLYANSRYNKIVVQHLTGLNDTAADRFMETYPADMNFVTEATDLELNMWILYNYRQWELKTASQSDAASEKVR